MMTTPVSVARCALNLGVTTKQIRALLELQLVSDVGEAAAGAPVKVRPQAVFDALVALATLDHCPLCGQALPPKEPTP